MKSFTLGQGSLSWKAALLSCSRVSCPCAWKIRGRSLSLAPVRTVNRNRSPRLKASGRQNNVGKGSRQERSLISGKGLALGVGCGGRCLIFECYRSCSILPVDNGFEYCEHVEQVVASGFPLHSEQATQNWNGRWESDCLIKTKHCECLSRSWHNAISAQCPEC